MNEREAFWAGEFGDAYNLRSPGSIKANYHFFHRALREAILRRGPYSVCELGAGVGNNLRALRDLLPGIGMAAVEINSEAVRRIPADVEVSKASILAWKPRRSWDLVFTKGVLIHIAPEDLPIAYDALWHAAGRYILIAEYFNPTPVEVTYRGHAGRLWKRDFASELLERFEELKVLDYGFTWRRDELAPQDDITWFLFEKRGEHGQRPNAA